MKKLKQAKKALMIDVPRFNSEAEEAEWWDTHAAEAGEFMRRAQRIGAMTKGITLPPARPTTIRLIAGDVERARALAYRRGLRYQTYLKMLIHEALEREGRAG